MADYLPMLRANQVFGRKSFGMPEMDDTSVGDMFARAYNAASDMKHDDMNRTKEMMEFQDSIRARAQDRSMAAQQFAQNARFGPNRKQVVMQQAPLTSMQQKFRQEDEENRENKFKLGQINALESGKLGTALASGQQRSDAEMAKTAAELAAAASEGKASRASAEKIAADKLAAESGEKKTERDFKSKEAQDARNDKGWLPTTIDDPQNPGNKIAARMNVATGQVERLKIDDQQVTGPQKLGTPGKAGSTTPAMQNNRKMTQSALDELDEMLDEGGKVKPHIATATGPSRLPGAAANWLGLGALTPETTKGTTAINTFKSKLILDLISQLKAQSKTGATGFGALNLKELGVLESSAGKLNPDMSDADFEKELNTIRGKLKMIMEDEPEAKGAAKTRLNSQELIKKYGGPG